nr:hypothetical protein [Tanacetum cinerariifolium]
KHVDGGVKGFINVFPLNIAFGTLSALLPIGVVLDHLVAEYVVVDVACPHPVKCLEYLQHVKMNFLSSKKAQAEITQENGSKRAGNELEQKSSKKQKIDDGRDDAELKQLVNIILKEDIAIDAIPLAVKTPTVDWMIYKEGKKRYYQTIRDGGKLKNYLVFSHMLKDFDKEDVETLWRLVKAKHVSTRPEKGYEGVLWGDLKVMFDPHVEDEVWKLQQSYKVVKWTLFN